MDRLLGGDGSAPTVRLGLPPDAPPEEVRRTIDGLHGYWRRVARGPLTEPQLARAADVLLRTCEGLAASLAPAPPPPPAAPPRPTAPPPPPAREPALPSAVPVAVPVPVAEPATDPTPGWADAPTRENAPVDPTPLDSAPLDSAPLDSAPLDSAPVDSAPLDSAPVDSAGRQA
jgi:outer membrane biosynthesis protein TonB